MILNQKQLDTTSATDYMNLGDSDTDSLQANEEDELDFTVESYPDAKVLRVKIVIPEVNFNGQNTLPLIQLKIQLTKSRFYKSAWARSQSYCPYSG